MTLEQVFIALHTIVILMKQHSYSFYNGHLSEVYRRSKIIENTLSEIQIGEGEGRLVASHGKLECYHQQQDDMAGEEHSNITTVIDPAVDARLCSLLLKDGQQLRHDQVEQLCSILEQEREQCLIEIGGKENVKYPENVTWTNYLEYLFFPTSEHF